MIHYHGAPISGGKDQAREFYSGRHALVSHCYREQLPEIAEVCQSYILDNGAYTHWKQERKGDYWAYVEWVARWSRHPAFDWAVIPDSIEGNQEENDNLILSWPTILPGVPVWHPHETVARFVDLARWSIAYGVRVVAIGGSPHYPTAGSKMWWNRMCGVLDRITDRSGRPSVKLHGLKMLDPAITERIPLASGDSTNATANAGSIRRFGTYPPGTGAGRGRVIADRIESQPTAAAWRKRQQMELCLNDPLSDLADRISEPPQTVETHPGAAGGGDGALREGQPIANGNGVDAVRFAPDLLGLSERMDDLHAPVQEEASVDVDEDGWSTHVVKMAKSLATWQRRFRRLAALEKVTWEKGEGGKAGPQPMSLVEQVQEVEQQRHGAWAGAKQRPTEDQA